ncbi:MAG: hypothetical protein NTZ10_02165 [Candidatus Saganbacteria bacterium]|nr:hypothetical protein [Candidatus Saganbacteria bacterium]
MRKISKTKAIAFVILCYLLALPALSVPVFLDAGLNAGNSSDGSISGKKNAWSSKSGKDMVFWIKVQPGSDLEEGEIRYQFMLDMTAPDKEMVLSEGPYNFDNGGEGRIFKNTWYFANARTINFPTPEVYGTWEVGFSLRNKNTGEVIKAKTFNFEFIDSTK